MSEFVFDPNAAAAEGSGIFGLPFSEDKSLVVIQPVPWEVTTSYGDGTSRGPELVLQESGQVDLFDIELGNFFERGIFCRPIPEIWLRKNNELKPQTRAVRDGLAPHPERVIAEVNTTSRELTSWLREEMGALLKLGKIPAVLGGDHSSPLGLIQAVSTHYKGEVAVLHFDAHADLRKSYQGYEQSHASIMRNVMESEEAPRKLVQVGIRDFCEEEWDYIRSSQGRVETFFDWDLKKAQLQGRPWSEQVAQIVGRLPENVYVSFDIDGLDPAFCPNTGTPVPGGLSFDQAVYLLREVHQTGRKIVGFDLNEVSPSTGPLDAARWDGAVGARLLYKMCGYAISNYPLTRASRPPVPG